MLTGLFYCASLQAYWDTPWFSLYGHPVLFKYIKTTCVDQVHISKHLELFKNIKTLCIVQVYKNTFYFSSLSKHLVLINYIKTPCSV